MHSGIFFFEGRGEKIFIWKWQKSVPLRLLKKQKGKVRLKIGNGGKK